MSADFGMAVTLVFWIVTLALAATGRGRGRYARGFGEIVETEPSATVYPIAPRRQTAKRRENLPQAS